MTTCTRCGHQIEVGRFCTNCGAPVGSAGPGPTDTAERPAVPAPPTPPPPPLPPAPTSARFPLFADEVHAAQGPVRAAPTGPPPSSPPPAEPPPDPTPAAPRPAHRRRTGWLIWVVIAAVLVVVALAGASLLLADGDGDDDRADDPAGTASSTPPAEETSPPAEPGTPTPSEEAPAGEPGNVAGAASARVPATAPPGTDVDGTRIRYDAGKMLDDDPETCWRMTGDGSGREIVLTLAEPTTVSALGLINGYAKTARDGRGRPLNWYAGNRRIRSVEWVLDDGTVVPQDLQESRDLQAVEIEPVETTRIVLRLVEVSGPGKGRAARDNTAVSEIAVVGTPAG